MVSDKPTLRAATTIGASEELPWQRNTAHGSAWSRVRLTIGRLKRIAVGQARHHMFVPHLPHCQSRQKTPKASLFEDVPAIHVVRMPFCSYQHLLELLHAVYSRAFGVHFITPSSSFSFESVVLQHNMALSSSCCRPAMN